MGWLKREEREERKVREVASFGARERSSEQEVRGGREVQEVRNVREVLKLLTTFLLVCLGWVLFRAESISSAKVILWRIVTQMDLSFLQQSKSIVLFAVLMLAAEWWQLPLPRRRWQRWAIYYLLIGLMLWKATTSTQFIYFQF